MFTRNSHKEIPLAPVIKALVMLLALPLVFVSCLGLQQTEEKMQFYTLEYDPPQVDDLAPLPVVIRVEKFSVAPPYDTYRIIYRDRSFKRDAYSFYKWRAGPGDLVTYFLGRDLQASGLFKAVLPQDSRAPVSHVVEGRVEEFFEWDAEPNWKAVLSLSIVLSVADEPDVSKRILFQRTYHATFPCEQKNPRALAAAMSRDMSEISNKIIRDIYDATKAHPGGSQ
jgi:ABC-type uncharacterized transport system auxiliary subunit